MNRLLVLQLGLFVAASASGVEYLYVEPNVGSSAGGHVAVRFGDTVYDYQNAASDTLRLRRAPYEHFRYVYSVLENRTIHVARLELPGETRDALLERFNTKYLIQEKHFAELQSLQADLELIRSLGETEPAVRLQVRGAGFFYGEDARTSPARSEAIAALRARVEARHGEGYLRARSAALEQELTRLSPGEVRRGAADPTDDEHPGGGYHFSDRYHDLVAKLLALRALEASRALRPEVRHAPADADFQLSSALREALCKMARSLEDRLVALVVSQRPDWGYPLLLGMARLEVLHASLRSNHLVFLDAFGPDPFTLEPSAVSKSRSYIAELSERASTQFAASRARFATSGELGEWDLARLEDAANRYLEFRRGLRDQRAVRMQSDVLLAVASAEVPGLAVPRVAAQTLEWAEAAVSERAGAYERALHEAFGYRLLARNCATEILATLDAELGALDFIPAVSYRSVIEALPVAALGEVPSYRRVRLAAMYAAENDLLVYLRESNTLTSEIYRANDRDSAFLFFTEDTAWIRPLYGSVNLAVAIGEMGWGLLRAPFDRGRTLWSGMKGVFFSLPELAFVSLRKGSLEYGPSDPPRTLLAMLEGPGLEVAHPRPLLPELPRSSED